MKRSGLLLAAITLFSVSAGRAAPTPAPATLMAVTGAATPESGGPGGSFALRIDSTLSKSWHVNAH